jgi:hypothetical protein
VVVRVGSELTVEDAVEDPARFFEKLLAIDVFRDQSPFCCLVVEIAIGLNRQSPALAIGDHEIDALVAAGPLWNDLQVLVSR